MRWSEEGGACLTSVKASALLELRDFYDIWRGRGNNRGALISFPLGTLRGEVPAQSVRWLPWGRRGSSFWEGRGNQRVGFAPESPPQFLG